MSENALCYITENALYYITDAPSLSHQMGTRDLEPIPRQAATIKKPGRKVTGKLPIVKM